MKNINIKIDDNDTSQGVVVASDYNATFSEIKNAVLQNEPLDEVDDSQLAKAIQRAASSLYYNDIGTVNTVTLKRYASQLVRNETVTGGETLLFKPKFTNTGAVTMKVGDTPRKQVEYANGLTTGLLTVGAMRKGTIHLAVFEATKDKYIIESVGGANLYYGRAVVDEKLSQVDEKISRVDGKLPLVIPAGAIFTFPFFDALTPPDGYLWCNGAQISKTQFARLFSAIGMQYNSVKDDKATDLFRVPDYRDQFLRGLDTSKNRVVGSKQDDDFQSHRHTFGKNKLPHVLTQVTATDKPIDGPYDGHIDYHRTTSQVASDTDADYFDMNHTGGTETRPKNIAVAYAIKF